MIEWNNNPNSKDTIVFVRDPVGNKSGNAIEKITSKQLIS